MTFDQFYRDLYWPRHENRVCRYLHLIGLPVTAFFVIFDILFQYWWLLLLTPVPAYLFGWLGHLWARNNPTFFLHPYWSFLGFWKMIGRMLTPDREPSPRRATS